MQPPREVEVFSFHVFEDAPENPRVASYKATLTKIREVGGIALPGTGQLVSAGELDDAGRYRRVNTGWGELGA